MLKFHFGKQRGPAMKRGLIALLITTTAALGCSTGTKTYKVRGTVSWKGTPIEKGQIHLYAEDNTTPPASAPIIHGNFEMEAPPGRKRVEIYSQKQGEFDKTMGASKIYNDIPPEYNSNSKLRFEVQPNNDNVLNLQLPQ